MDVINTSQRDFKRCVVSHDVEELQYIFNQAIKLFVEFDEGTASVYNEYQDVVYKFNLQIFYTIDDEKVNIPPPPETVKTIGVINHILSGFSYTLDEEGLSLFIDIGTREGCSNMTITITLKETEITKIDNAEDINQEIYNLMCPQE